MSEPLTVEAGDVVVLASGGPTMTVVSIDLSDPANPSASCCWFYNNLLLTNSFNPTLLARVPDNSALAHLGGTGEWRKP